MSQNNDDFFNDFNKMQKTMMSRMACAGVIGLIVNLLIGLSFIAAVAYAVKWVITST